MSTVLKGAHSKGGKEGGEGGGGSRVPKLHFIKDMWK